MQVVFLPGRLQVESRELPHLDKLAHLICNELRSYHQHWNKNILESYKYTTWIDNKWNNLQCTNKSFQSNFQIYETKTSPRQLMDDFSFSSFSTPPSQIKTTKKHWFMIPLRLNCFGFLGDISWPSRHSLVESCISKSSRLLDICWHKGNI